MATFVGVHNKVYVGHVDMTCHTQTINFGDLTRTMVPATTFCDAGYTAVKPGLITGTAAITGLQDFAASTLDSEFSVDQLGSQYPITVVPNPTGTVSVGDAAWLSRGVLAKVNPLDGAKGDMAKVMLELPYDAAIPQGYVAHTMDAVTTSASDSGINVTGPTTGQSLYAGLHVSAYSGFDSASIEVESDDAVGFGSATSRITFTTVTGTTSEWSSVAGDLSTETYWRVKYTLNGSGSITFAVAIGVI